MGAGAVCGLRRGELWALRWEDIDLDAGVIQVRRAWDDREGEQKSGAGTRRVPIAAVLRRILIEHKLRQGGEDPIRIVIDSDGKVKHSTTLTERAHNIWKAAGLEPIGLHECRHTFASLMIAAGVNAKALSTYIGHASISITMDRYGHLMPGSEAEAAGCLDAYLGHQFPLESRSVFQLGDRTFLPAQSSWPKGLAEGAFGVALPFSAAKRYHPCSLRLPDAMPSPICRYEVTRSTLDVWGRGERLRPSIPKMGGVDVKYFISAAPGPMPPTPELFDEALAWLEGKVDDGTFDCIFGFLEGGGSSVATPIPIARSWTDGGLSAVRTQHLGCASVARARTGKRHVRAKLAEAQAAMAGA